MKLNLDKSKFAYIGICIVLELMFFIAMRNSDAKLTLILGVIGIPCVLGLINFMFLSLERAILAIGFLIPMLPISGYVMIRLGLLHIQWVMHAGFYIISAIALIKNGLLKSIKKENIVIKNKIIRSILLILLIISSILAFDKLLSFKIILLSFIPFGLYILILKSIEVRDKKKFLNDVLFAVCLGCIVSSIPDILYFFMTWMGGNKYIRIFGPIGSNFILIYDLIILPILIAKWINEKAIKSVWTILVLSMCFIMSMQLSRGAWINFIAIFVIYLIFDVKNWKKYLPLLLVFGAILTYNVIDRPDVKSDSSLQEIQGVIVGHKVPDVDLGERGPNKLLRKLIESQSKSRQIIWESAIGMTKDHPYTGVGIGNFKYFFQEYSGSPREYSDAHSVIFNMSSELGVPFTVLSIILTITIGIRALINYFRCKNRRVKVNNIAIMCMITVFILYGNLTGISFQTTSEIYSFTPTFIILFGLFYVDYVEEF
jgi:O-antigen ligase